MTTHRHTSRVEDRTAERSDVCGEPAIVAIAWPTGRPIHPYTADELANGVDVYTRALKARAAATRKGGRRDAD